MRALTLLFRICGASRDLNLTDYWICIRSRQPFSLRLLLGVPGASEDLAIPSATRRLSVLAVPLPQETRPIITLESIAHRGKIRNTTETTVITTDAPSRNGNANFWCSRNSIPVSPTSRNGAGVNGLTGKPVVCKPSKAACAI